MKYYKEIKLLVSMVWKGEMKLKCINCKISFESEKPHVEIDRKTVEGKVTLVFCSDRCLNEFIAVRSIKVSKEEELTVVKI